MDWAHVFVGFSVDHVDLLQLFIGNRPYELVHEVFVVGVKGDQVVTLPLFSEKSVNFSFPCNRICLFVEECVTLHKVVNIDDPPMFKIHSICFEKFFMVVIDQRQSRWLFQLAFKNGNMITGVIFTVKFALIVRNVELANILKANRCSEKHLAMFGLFGLSEFVGDVAEIAVDFYGVDVILGWNLLIVPTLNFALAIVVAVGEEGVPLLNLVFKELISNDIHFSNFVLTGDELIVLAVPLIIFMNILSQSKLFPVFSESVVVVCVVLCPLCRNSLD